MHIYPAIDLLGGRCVRLVQGDYARETVFSDSPGDVAAGFVAQGATRLHAVDLDGAKLGKPVNVDAVRAIVGAAGGVPVQLGGGIRTPDDLATVFGLGVRWVVLGTRALQDPAFLIRMATEYPGRIVLGLDARNGYVATDGWLVTSSTLATELVAVAESAPLAAVVYTDIARDGLMAGPNLPALRAMMAATRRPVIASGGISNLSQAAEVAATGCYGAIVGRALYEGAVTLPELLGLATARDV